LHNCKKTCAPPELEQETMKDLPTAIGLDTAEAAAMRACYIGSHELEAIAGYKFLNGKFVYNAKNVNEFHGKYNVIAHLKNDIAIILYKLRELFSITNNSYTELWAKIQSANDDEIKKAILPWILTYMDKTLKDAIKTTATITAESDEKITFSINIPSKDVIKKYIDKTPIEWEELFDKTLSGIYIGQNDERSLEIKHMVLYAIMWMHNLQQQLKRSFSTKEKSLDNGITLLALLRTFLD
jgi:hypothetical protein